MSNDEHMSFLRNLVVQGTISVEQEAQLKEHLKMCRSCGETYADFVELFSPGSQMSDKEIEAVSRKTTSPFLQDGYWERFVVRAREQGIYFEELAAGNGSLFAPLSFLSSGLIYSLAAVALLLLAGSGLLGYRLWDTSKQLADSTSEVRQRSEETDELRQRLAELSYVRQSLEAGLADASNAHELTRTEVRELEARLGSVSAEMVSLSSALAETSSWETSLRNKLAGAEQNTAKTSDHLEQAQLKLREKTSTIAAQEVEIYELTRRAEEETAELDRARRLLAADERLRELMGSRNLHITDVFDVNGRGRTLSSFGRIFFTEGKSLVFYAFDLDKSKANGADRSFQVWGYREPAVHSSQSLGVFYLDDEDQQRWVFKSDDSAVLQDIDAIFVTAEPFGGGSKPTGRKLLYAYLGNIPNHP